MSPRGRRGIRGRGRGRPTANPEAAQPAPAAQHVPAAQPEQVITVEFIDAMQLMAQALTAQAQNQAAAANAPARVDNGAVAREFLRLAPSVFTKFSAPQIKRILRVASTEQEVYDAVMLVKRLGPDVREGKRRQFSYIGRLLREVEPELMDGLIQATKDGDQTKLQALSGLELSVTEDVEEEVEETEYEDDEDDSEDDIALADRWFDGLINKDVGISKEIYSLSEVDFDRQELCGLVRKVQSIREKVINSDDEEGKVKSDIVRAERSLTCFLRNLAKQLHS